MCARVTVRCDGSGARANRGESVLVYLVEETREAYKDDSDVFACKSTGRAHTRPFAWVISGRGSLSRLMPFAAFTSPVCFSINDKGHEVKRRGGRSHTRARIASQHGMKGALKGLFVQMKSQF